MTKTSVYQSKLVNVEAQIGQLSISKYIYSMSRKKMNL